MNTMYSLTIHFRTGAPFNMGGMELQGWQIANIHDCHKRKEVITLSAANGISCTIDLGNANTVTIEVEK